VKKILFPILLTIALSACLPLSSTPTPEPTPPDLPEAPAPASQVDSLPGPASPAWKEVRDARFGFGLAVPCWWIVNPILPQGVGGVMTLMNYDEAYFNANSQKGYWDWSNGALKIDLVVMEGISPTLADGDAYMAFVDSTMQGLISAEARHMGTNTITELALENLINPNDPPAHVFIYRLAPDKLLTVNPIPAAIKDTSDFQTLLSSIALSPQEPVILPTTAPAAAPLISASCLQ
jgi:hypothetical protein